MGHATFSQGSTYFVRKTEHTDLFNSGTYDKKEIKRVQWLTQEALLELGRQEVNRDVHCYILCIGDDES